MRKMRLLLLALLLSSCSAAQHPTELVDEWVSWAGVIVEDDDREYLTREMADAMERDLAEQLPRVGLTKWDLLDSVVGVHVRQTLRPDLNGALGRMRATTWHDGKRQVLGIELARTGRCAYETGRLGPPYEHELAHAVLFMRLGDTSHESQLWTLISAERPCP